MPSSEHPESDNSKNYKLETVAPLFDEVWKLQTKNSLHSPCEPNYIWNIGADNLRPSLKFLQYEALAVTALNSKSAVSLQPPTSKERQLGRVVSESALKLRNYDTPYQELLEELEKLHELFAGLDLESTQRVIAETNRTLEPNDTRIAQSESGEIWLGKKSSLSGQYTPEMAINKIECDVS